MWTLDLNTVQLFGCFIVNVPTTKLIGYMRALRIVYDNDVSTFHQLLAMDKSFCIHHQNIQRLLIEIYKALHDISGNSLKELFVKRESSISLLSKPELVISSVNSLLKGKKSLRYFGCIICNTLPFEIREDHSISSFVHNVYVPYLRTFTVTWLFRGFCNVYFWCFYSPNGSSV